ncbi:MAG TPA: response regulator [Burkholderiaceae bacterium]|nr:response regulator [Burkholderiaceae bacterium]
MPDAPAASTVFLVDDEAAVREALSFLFESRGIAVLSFDGAPALLSWLDAHPGRRRGCFLLDVRMDGMSGLALHDALISRKVRNPVLFLTGHGDVAMAVEALKKGAFDFIEKPYSDNTLVDRVSQALAVDAAMGADETRGAEVRARLASLTPRERDVMLRVVAGKLNKIIADELHISMRTVEVARARVFSKLAVRSAAEVATLLATYGKPAAPH